MKTRPAVLAVAAFLFAAHASAADLLKPPDTSRYLRWGPLRVRPGFAVPAIGYDDNVFSRSGTAEPEGDYLIRLSPRIEGLVFFGKAGFLKFNERFDYTAYAQFSDQNYYENRLDTRLLFPFRRFGVFGDYAINRLRDIPGSELDSRPIRREARWGVGGIAELGWRTDVELGYYESRWTNDDPDRTLSGGFTFAELNDRVETGPRLKVRYRLTGLTRLTLDALARDIVFDDPDVGRDSAEWAVLPGFEFGQGAALTGAVKLGRAQIDAQDPTAPDYSGPIGSLALAYRLTSATRVRLEGGRKVGFATYEGFRYYQDDYAEVRAVHYLTRIFGIEAAAGGGRLEFPGATGTDPRVDDVARYEAGLRVRLPESVLGRTTEYTLGVRNYRRDSSVDTLDQSRSVVAFGASVGF